MDLDGKVGLILGVANKRSIAWGIAQGLAAAGVKLALTYQGERLEGNVRGLAEALDEALVLPCDVTVDEEVDALFASIKEQYGRLDFLIHAVAFAPADELKGDFVNTSREGYRIAQDVSSYSLVAVARGARPLMEAAGGGSIVTLTYYGSEKAVPGYNVMGTAKAALEASVRYLAHNLGPAGIRVNAISAGPIATLAARGVPRLSDMLRMHAERAPLRRNVEVREVADTAVFLCSPMASGITGEVVHVDGGYNVMGL